MASPGTTLTGMNRVTPWSSSSFKLRSCPAIQPLLSYSDPNSSYTFISQTSRSKPVAFTAAADQYRCFFVNMGDRFMNGYLEEQAPRATDPECSPFIFQRLRDAKGYSTKAVTDCMTSVQHGKAAGNPGIPASRSARAFVKSLRRQKPSSCDQPPLDSSGQPLICHSKKWPKHAGEGA